jgi:Type II secretion system (T2SS), protein E, N-terminal domain
MSVPETVNVPSSAPAESQPTRLRVRVDDATALKPLRCYCLRLGATIAPNEDGSFDAWLEDDSDLGDYLASWATANGVPVEISDPEASPRDREASPRPIEPGPAPTGHDMFTRPRLGDLLVTKRLINEIQLSQALEESRTTGQMLGRVLLEKQWIFEDDLARTLSEQWNLPYVSLMRLGVDRDVAVLLPREIALAKAAIPVRRSGDGCVTVAFADPTDDARAAVQTYIPWFSPVIAELSDILMAIRALPAV